MQQLVDHAAERLLVQVDDIRTQPPDDAADLAGIDVEVPVDITRPADRQLDDVERLSSEIVRAGPLGRDDEGQLDPGADERAIALAVRRVPSRVIDTYDPHAATVTRPAAQLPRAPFDTCAR